MISNLLVMKVLLLLVLIPLGYCQVAPICSSEAPGPNDRPLPQLPDQFYLSMEASLIERNLSVFVVEYFDGPGNRGRIEFTGQGRKTNGVVDYNLKEVFVYPNPRTGDDCTVSIIGAPNQPNRPVRFIFGISPGPNNTVHIGSPSLFFGLVNVTNFTYLGIDADESRGIPCYHWVTCHNSFNSSFTLDFYFTDNNLWNTSYPDSTPIPVLIKLNGSVLNMSTGLEYSVLHYYSFVDFRSGPNSVPDDVFNIPLDLVCKGRLPGQSLPAFPKAFSANIEFVTSTGISNVKEYYDLNNQLVRINGYFAGSPYIFVQDFNVGSQYSVNANFQNCTIQKITTANSFFDSTVGTDGQLHLRSPRDLFLASSMFNFTYEGVSMVRGIAVDVWISPREFQSFFNANVTNGVYIIYISRPGQRISSEFGITTDPVIVQAQYNGFARVRLRNGTIMENNLTATFSVYDFSSVEPSLDVYDTTVCLLPSDYVTLRFSLPLKARSSNLFRSTIRSALFNYSKQINIPFLSPLQINNIQVDTIGVSSVIVSVRIANLSRNSTVTWNYSAQSFVNKLTSGLQNNDPLPFTIKFSDNVVTPLYMTDSSTSSCVGATSTAVTAGVSVALFVFGTLVGVIFSFIIFVCLQKHRGKSTSVSFSHKPQEGGQYKRQVDEADDSTLNMAEN